jgi:hypothetical protein
MTDIEFEGKKVKKLMIGRFGLNLTFRILTEDGNQYSLGYALRKKPKSKKLKEKTK